MMSQISFPLSSNSKTSFCIQINLKFWLTPRLSIAVLQLFYCILQGMWLIKFNHILEGPWQPNDKSLRFYLFFLEVWHITKHLRNLVTYSSSNICPILSSQNSFTFPLKYLSERYLSLKCSLNYFQDISSLLMPCTFFRSSH